MGFLQDPIGATNATLTRIDPSRGWNRAARGASRNMAEGAREEFEQAMNNLFDNKVNPLMNNISYIASQKINQAQQAAINVVDRAAWNVAALKNEVKGDIESLLNNVDAKYKDNLTLTFEEINQARAEAILDLRATIGDVDQSLENRINQIAFLLMNVVAKAQEISDNFTPGAFRTQLIDPTFDRIDKLENQLYQNLDQLLDKVFQGYQVAVEDVREKILNGLSIVDKKSGIRKDSFYPVFVWSLTDMEFYRYSTWLEMQKINKAIEKNDSLQKVVDSYLQLQINASRMNFRAKTLGVRELQTICCSDWLRYGQASQLYTSYLK